MGQKRSGPTSTMLHSNLDFRLVRWFPWIQVPGAWFMADGCVQTQGRRASLQGVENLSAAPVLRPHCLVLWLHQGVFLCPSCVCSRCSWMLDFAFLQKKRGKHEFQPQTNKHGLDYAVLIGMHRGWYLNFILVTSWIWLSNLSNWCSQSLASHLLISLNKLINENVLREDFLWAEHMVLFLTPVEK